MKSVLLALRHNELDDASRKWLTVMANDNIGRFNSRNWSKSRGSEFGANYPKVQVNDIFLTSVTLSGEQWPIQLNGLSSVASYVRLVDASFSRVGIEVHTLAHALTTMNHLEILILNSYKI